ncbi:MAG TPA: hypothetical protein VMI54_22040, partial [Polyangiaceae bacterium]|nr:hypothetical protein [Polyangiaceae bacterium]
MGADDGLLFVDVEGADIKELRSAPPDLVFGAKQVLVRLSAIPSGKRKRQESTALVAKIVHALNPGAECALLLQTAGKEPALAVHGRATWPNQVEVLARARKVELDALLDWGDGVWRPTDYHYQLPSGEHAGSFVKLADAIRSPHDAKVLASWLFASVRKGCGIVVDTGTLTPLVLALEAAATGEGIPLGNVIVLDEYPHTQLDVSSAVR